MADIKTQEQYDRTFKVYQTGVTERGTRADKNQIGDLTVAMTCPKGFPRDIPLSRVQRMQLEKNFILGHPKRKVSKPKKQTKAQEAKVVKELLKEAGAKELPNIQER